MAMLTIPQAIVIAKDGDLTIRFHKVMARGEIFDSASGKGQIEGRILATMKVSRQVLIDNSRPFKVELTGERWEESCQSVIDMQVDSVPSVEVALRVIHNALNADIDDMAIPDIWELIQYCDYRELDLEKFESWFAKLMIKKNYTKLEHGDMVQLLFPAYKFDHAHAFAFFTQSLAYQLSEHITEVNPTSYRHLHLDGNVIGSINGAKGSPRSKLIRGLCDPIGDFATKMTCTCRAESLLSYVTALTKTGLWPLQDHYKKPVQVILDSPGLINFNCKIPDGAYLACRAKLAANTTAAVRKAVLDDFDGLCLDDIKRTKKNDVDEDYWEHDIEKDWSSGCRIAHGQPTWYFSFMGRKTDMAKHKAQKRQAWLRSLYDD